MQNNRISNVVDPIDAQDVATKNYAVAKSGDTLTGNLNMDGNVIKGLSTSQPLSDDEAVSWGQTVSLISNAMQTAFQKKGDTMNGEINMGNHKITNLSDPQNNSDASTKAYVDQAIIKAAQNPITNVKSIITLWAEQKGHINNDSFEWS